MSETFSKYAYEKSFPQNCFKPFRNSYFANFTDEVV
jgi:hypothetical protein